MANVYLDNIKFNEVSSREDSYIAFCPFVCDIGQYGFNVIPPREFSNQYNGGHGDLGFNSAKVLNNNGYTTVCFRHMPWKQTKYDMQTSSMMNINGSNVHAIQTTLTGLPYTYEYFKITHNNKSIVFFMGDDYSAYSKLPVCVNASYFYRIDGFKSPVGLFVYIGTLLSDMVGINIYINNKGLLFASNDNNEFTYEYGAESPFKSYPMSRIFYDENTNIRFESYDMDGSISKESDYGIVVEATDDYVSVKMSKSGRVITNSLSAMYINTSNRTDLAPRKYSCVVLKGDSVYYDANDPLKSSVLYVEKFYAKPEYTNNYTRRLDFADSPLVSTESSILSAYDKIVYATSFQAGTVVDLDNAIGGFGTYIKVETNSGNVITIQNPDSRVYRMASWLLDEFQKIIISKEEGIGGIIFIKTGDELFVLDEKREDGSISAWDKYNYLNTTSYSLRIKEPNTGFSEETFFVLSNVMYGLYAEYIYTNNYNNSNFDDNGFVIVNQDARMLNSFSDEITRQLNMNKKIKQFIKFPFCTYYEISQDKKEKLLSDINSIYTEQDFVDKRVPLLDESNIQRINSDGDEEYRIATFMKVPQENLTSFQVYEKLQQQLKNDGFSVEYDNYDNELRVLKTNVVVVPPLFKDIIVDNWEDGLEDVMIYNYDKYKALDMTCIEPRLSNDIYVKIERYKDFFNQDVDHLFTVYSKEGTLEQIKVSLKPYSKFFLDYFSSKYVTLTVYKDENGNPKIKHLPIGTFYLGRARKLPVTDDMKIANIANNKINDIDFDFIIDGGEGSDVFKLNLLNEFIDYDNLKFIYVPSPDENISQITTFLGYSGAVITDLIVNYNGTYVPLYVVYLSMFLNNRYCGLVENITRLNGTPTELYKDKIMTIYQDDYRFVLSHNFVKVYNNPYFAEFAIILSRIKRDIATTVNFQQSKNRISGQISILLNYFVTTHSNVIFSSNVLNVDISNRTCRVTIETVFNAFRLNPITIDVVIDIKET